METRKGNTMKNREVRKYGERRDLLELAYAGYRLLPRDTWMTMSFITFWTLVIIGTR